MMGKESGRVPGTGILIRGLECHADENMISEKTCKKTVDFAEVGRKKRHFTAFFCILFAALFFCAVVPAQAGVKLSKTYVVLLLGQEGKDTFQLKVSGVSGEDKIKFSVKDKAVVKVDGTGKLTAAAPGKTTVTCTVTAPDGTKAQETVTVRVYDNIKSIALSINGVSYNALHKNTAYALTYTCKTNTGTNKNVGNSIHYEVRTLTGEHTDDAFIDADGNFMAKDYGSYAVYVYAFQNSNNYKAWVKDREKAADNVLAQDMLTVTVTPVSYRTKQQEIGTFSVTLPLKYEIHVSESSKNRIAFSAQVKNEGGQNAISNIQVIMDRVEEAQSYDLLSAVMTSVYTKNALQQSWKSAYHAEKAAVKNLSSQKMTAGEREILKIRYELTLRSITIRIKEDEDIRIGRMDFVNTVYTWYDGDYHISVTVTDALEPLFPNISDAAGKMVDKLMRVKDSK